MNEGGTELLQPPSEPPALSPNPRGLSPGSLARVINSHKQKRKYLPFYKEKLPLPNKKVISQAVGLDGEVLNHPEETHGPVRMCVGVSYGQPRASCLGRLEAGGPSHMPHATPHACIPPSGLPAKGAYASKAKAQGPSSPDLDRCSLPWPACIFHVTWELHTEAMKLPHAPCR